MEAIPLSWLYLSLLVLLALSAFFSSSETALMALNRYRLRSRVRQGDRAAARAARLLERPDRLIGVILLGNNAVNIAASALTTLIALRTMGEAGIALATGLLTLAVLIFAEVLPKTLAVLNPERIALPAARVLAVLLWALYPIVALVNGIANLFLRAFGVRPEQVADRPLSPDELRVIVREASPLIPRKHQQMLHAILDLEQATVEDIMVPRAEIEGIDLAADLPDIEDRILGCRHTRLPVYRNNLDQLVGVLHVRDAVRLVARGELSREHIEKVVAEPYFVPADTPLNTQLINFQRNRQRLGLVVDEYGDILGLVTLDDLLEEIVGEFTTDTQDYSRIVHRERDGSYLVDASATIRELNHVLPASLPSDGPKTLNGLIIERLESIPTAGTSLRLGPYVAEVVQAGEQAVRTVRLVPQAAAEGADDPVTRGR